MKKTVIYLLSDPTTKRGYIVADIDNDRGRLGKYLEDYKMTCGGVLTPKVTPTYLIYYGICKGFIMAILGKLQ